MIKRNQEYTRPKNVRYYQSIDIFNYLANRVDVRRPKDHHPPYPPNFLNETDSE